MDELDRLIQAFRARATSSAVARLNVLMDIERLVDLRIPPFLLEVLADPNESWQVRSHVLKQLRNGRLSQDTRLRIAAAMMRILADASWPQLQSDAALALAEFTDIEGVPAALGSLTRDATVPIDLRYSAFTSLERTGPTTECVALLRQLSTDEIFGRSAHNVLSAWHLA